jgi:hypothetical protein
MAIFNPLLLLGTLLDCFQPSIRWRDFRLVVDIGSSDCGVVWHSGRGVVETVGER